MLDTNFKQQPKYTAQDKLDEIKLSITRLLMVGSVWTLFFMLYDLKVSEELTFKPIILGLLALYALGEIILLFYYLSNTDNNN